MKRNNQLIALLLTAAMTITPTTSPVFAAERAGDANHDNIINAEDAAVYLQTGSKLGAETADKILTAACKCGLEETYQDALYGDMNFTFDYDEYKNLPSLGEVHVIPKKPSIYESEQILGCTMPVFITVDTKKPINCMEFGFTSELKYQIYTIDQMEQFKDTSWYQQYEKSFVNIPLTVAQNNERDAWIAYAGAEAKMLKGIVAVAMVEIPDDKEVLYDLADFMVLGFTSRSAFMANAQKDSSERSLIEHNRAGIRIGIPEHVAISITKKPDKLVYAIGEELDLTGGEASASGSNEGLNWDTFYRPLTDSCFQLDTSEFDSTKPGTYKIYVSVHGAEDTATVSTDSFEVTVTKDGKPVETTETTETSDSIMFCITKLPAKMVYQIGEELDLTGIETYVDDFNDETYLNDKPFTDFEVDASEFDNTKAGSYPIHLTCKVKNTTKTISFWVDVTDVSEPSQEQVEPTTLPPSDPENMFIDVTVTPPAKKIYHLGETLNLTGGTICIHAHENGEDWDLPEQPLTSASDIFYVVSDDFDSSKPGFYNIRVCYNGKYLIGAREFTVTVLDADGNPPATEPIPAEIDPTEPCETIEVTAAATETYGGDRFGDVDRSGEIDIMDVIRLNKYLLGQVKLIAEEITFADVNRDGTIDSMDSIALLRKVLGMPAQDATESTTVPATEPTTAGKTDSGKHFFDGKSSKRNANGFLNEIKVYTNAEDCPYTEYDAAFFADKNLIVIEKTESSGSNELEVTDITANADGMYTVQITRTLHPVSTCDLAQWTIFAATDKGVTDAEHVQADYTDIMTPSEAL